LGDLVDAGQLLHHEEHVLHRGAVRHRRSPASVRGCVPRRFMS
jgi:hypothetical protein